LGKTWLLFFSGDFFIGQNAVFFRDFRQKTNKVKWKAGLKKIYPGEHLGSICFLNNKKLNAKSPGFLQTKI